MTTLEAKNILEKFQQYELHSAVIFYHDPIINITTHRNILSSDWNEVHAWLQNVIDNYKNWNCTFAAYMDGKFEDSYNSNLPGCKLFED